MQPYSPEEPHSSVTTDAAAQTRCGSDLSVGGLAPDKEIEKFLTALPNRSWEAWDDGQIQGLLVRVDEATGLAASVETVREHIKVTRPEARQ